MPSENSFAFKKVPLVIASAALIVMMMVTVIHVVGRLFFQSPLYGGVELISLSGVILISSAIGYTQAERAHIIIEILVCRLPRRWQLTFVILSLVISLGAVALAGWGAFLFAWDAVIKPGSLTPILRLPAAPFKFVLVAGWILLWGYFAGHLAEALRKLWKKEIKEINEPIS